MGGKKEDKRGDKKDNQEKTHRRKVREIAMLQWFAGHKGDPERLLERIRLRKQAAKKLGGRSLGSNRSSTVDASVVDGRVRSDWSATSTLVPARSVTTLHKSARSAEDDSEDDYGPPSSHPSRKQEQIVDWAAGVSPGTSAAAPPTGRSRMSGLHHPASPVLPSDSVSNISVPSLRHGSVGRRRAANGEPTFTPLPPLGHPWPAAASPGPAAARSPRASQRGGNSQVAVPPDLTSGVCPPGQGGQATGRRGAPAGKKAQRFGK